MPISNKIAFMYSPKHRAADCLQDIVDNIARIEEYTTGYNSEEIKADRLRNDAGALLGAYL